MIDSGWRDRLQAALDGKDKSAREISLKAGKGPGYLHSILKEGKDPTVESMGAVCEALGVSVSSILLGVEMSQKTEEILQRLGGSEEDQALMLQILQKIELSKTP